MASDLSLQEQYPSIIRVPHHIGIVMDGNGRWARARGLPRQAGHKAGTENIRPILTAATEFGIRVLTIYAFSTENWALSRRRGVRPDDLAGPVYPA